MNKKTTIYDIAQKLGITAATVSRALNNNPKISKSTKALVLKTAVEMNYEQNKLALALKSGKSYNVGIIVPRIDMIFFGSIIRAIEDELAPHGYHIIICQTHGDERKENELVLESISQLEDTRKCWRLVNGVLMEKTKLEVLPEMRTVINNLNAVTKQITDTLVAVKQEIKQLEGAYEHIMKAAKS